MRRIPPSLAWLIAISPIAAASAQSARAPTLTVEPAVIVAGTTPERSTLAERMLHHRVPGLGVAILRDGRIAWSGGWGVRQAGRAEPVTADTMFSVGSLSKVATAVIVLRLVDAGRLDLDRDVATYLTRWTLRRSPTAGDAPVTLRRLLSHTAGIGVSGFPDFQPGEALPTLIQSLDGVAPAKVGPIAVVTPPGEMARYSGGGTTIVQAVVEDVLGSPFEAAAKAWLFEPLGMRRSSFANPLDARFEPIARAHGPDGRPAALPRGYEAMPEQAASGLWTTPADYARMLSAIWSASRGAGGGILKPETAAMMLREVAPGPVGLGPFLDGRGATRRFYHSGSNDSYKAWFEMHESSGDGVVVFTNGANGAQLYPEVVRAVARAEDWPFPRPVRIPRTPPSSTWLDALPGNYRRGPDRTVIGSGANVFPFPERITISRDGSGLVVADADRPALRLRFVAADAVNFVQLDDPDRWLSFRSGPGDCVDTVVIWDGAYGFEARRDGSRGATC